MEVTDNTENVAPLAEDVPVKETEAEVEQSEEEPKAEEMDTNDDKNEEVKTTDKQKGRKSDLKSNDVPPPSSGDTEVRQPRVRKPVQRLSDVLSTSYSKAMEAKEKVLDEILAKGSGTPLGEIPLIEASIKKLKPADLKLLHYACFGRAGTVGEVRSNLRKFSGFPFDAKSDNYTKREAALNRKPVKEVQEALRQLHLEVSGTRAQIVTRLLEFLLKPVVSAVKYKGKLPPSKRGRKSKTDSSSEIKKNAKSGRKSNKSSKESDVEHEGSSDKEQEEASETEEKSETLSETSDRAASDSSDANDADFTPAGRKKQKKKTAAGKKSTPKKRKSAGASKSAPPAKRRKRAKKAETESESEHEDEEKEEDELSDLDASGNEKSTEKEKADEKTDVSDEDDKPLAKVSSSTSKSDEDVSGDGNKAEPSKPAAEVENDSAPHPSDEELKEKTLELLKKSDLNAVSMRIIRNSIAALYPGVDLSSKKDYLNGIIKEYLASSL